MDKFNGNILREESGDFDRFSFQNEEAVVEAGNLLGTLPKFRVLLDSAAPLQQEGFYLNVWFQGVIFHKMCIVEIFYHDEMERQLL